MRIQSSNKKIQNYLEGKGLREFFRNFPAFLIFFLRKFSSWLLNNLTDLPEKMESLSYYFGLWVKMSKNSFMVMLAQKKLFFLFLSGKLIRFTFFTVFLVFLVRGSGTLAGYSVNEAVFFFLTFNIVDIISQFLFREVYRFRPLVVSGDLDLILTKPYSPLFRSLLGGADIIDLVTIPPLFIATFYVGSFLDPSMAQVFTYFILVINSLVIAASFHIAVLALGILTFEVDHVIWIYRDLTNLGRFPIDIYKQPLQMILTYLIPVGLMMSIPVKSFLGIISFWGVLGTFIFGILTLVLSIKIWGFSLLKYKSASS